MLARTESTNADLVRDARLGQALPWSVLVAEHQVAGRGRLGRTWTSAPGATLTFSALVPTPADPGWVPLLAGLALVEAIEELYAVPTALKWPNDVLAPTGRAEQGRKLAGVLCELTPAGIVVGIGLNVDQGRDELPVPTATSLRLLAGAHPPSLTRQRLLLSILDHLAAVLAAWGQHPDELREAYRRRCATLGRAVQVDLRAGRAAAQAIEIDADGHLVVDLDGRRQALAAGDVTHLR